MRNSREKGAEFRDQELPFPTLNSGVKLSVPPSVLFCQRHDVFWLLLKYIHASNLLNPLQMIHYSCVHSILVRYTTPCLTKRRHPSKIPSSLCSLAHQRSCEESVSRVLLVGLFFYLSFLNWSHFTVCCSIM